MFHLNSKVIKVLHPHRWKDGLKYKCWQRQRENSWVRNAVIAALTQHLIKLLSDLKETGGKSQTEALNSALGFLLWPYYICCICEANRSIAVIITFLPLFILLLYCGQLALFGFLYRNYEHIVKAHQNNPQQGEDQVSDQVKFNIFQSIMDSLFQSFSNSVSVNSFQELSACVFSWIEEHCKPQVTQVSHRDQNSNIGQYLFIYLLHAVIVIVCVHVFFSFS